MVLQLPVLGLPAIAYRIVQTNDSASYSVVVSNAYGTATSADAVLTVREPPVDLVTSSIGWNGGHGVDFQYRVVNGPLATPTTAKLFWASGPTAANIIPGAPVVFTCGIAIGASGLNGTIQAPSSLFTTPPSGATHIILVLDPDNLVSDDDKSNNTQSLALNRIDLAAVKLALDLTVGNAVCTYSVSGADAPVGTRIRVYWAKGQTAADIIGTVFEQNLPRYEVGTYQFYRSALPMPPPPLATHALLVIDPPTLGFPQGAVVEAREDNNVYALPLCDKIGATTKIYGYVGTTDRRGSLIYGGNPMNYGSALWPYRPSFVKRGVRLVDYNTSVVVQQFVATGSDDRFEFSNLDPGKYRLQAFSYSDYVATPDGRFLAIPLTENPVTVEIRCGDQIQKDFWLQPTVSQLPFPFGGGGITINVKDFVTATDVAATIVQLYAFPEFVVGRLVLVVPAEQALKEVTDEVVKELVLKVIEGLAQDSSLVQKLEASVLTVSWTGYASWDPVTDEPTHVWDTCFEWFGEEVCPGSDDKLIIRAHSPVSIVVEDPLGRRAGVDVVHGVSYSDLPADYFTAPDGVALTLNQAYSRNYRVYVYGYGSGTYGLDAQSSSANWFSTAVATDKPVTVGQADGFQAFLPAGDGLGVWFTSATVPTLKPVQIAAQGSTEIRQMGARIEYPVTTNWDYYVEVRNSLSAWDTWQSLVGAPHNAGRVVAPMDSAQRFYRVRLTSKIPGTTNSTSIPVLATIKPTGVVSFSGQVATLSFPTSTNRDYYVEWRETLNKDTPWKVLPGAPHNTGSVTITNIGSSAFYHVRSFENNLTPVMYAQFTNNLGVASATNVSANLTLVGRIVNASQVASFVAGLDAMPTTNAPNLLTNLGINSMFTFNRQALDRIEGGVLLDGQHTLHLQALDSQGNILSGFDLTFRLDTHPPTVYLSSLATDVDTNRTGIQVYEGSLIPLCAGAFDDVSVAKLELLQNGQVIGTASQLPWQDFVVQAPAFSTNGNMVTFQARATDSAGNVTLSAPAAVEVLGDRAPLAILGIGPTNGAILPNGLSQIDVYFSKPVDPATLDLTNVSLVSAAPGGVLGGSNEVSIPIMDGVVQKGQPSLELSFPALGLGSYELRIHSNRLSDLAGNIMTNDFVLRFRVAGCTTVAAWGGNSDGQTNLPSGLTNIVQIAAGDYHSLALRADGTVVGWGYNYSGQSIGVPNRTSPFISTGVVAVGGSVLSNVVAIAGGGEHSLALLADGTVVAWGDSSYAQTNVPSGLSNVVAVAAAGYSSLASQADGTLVGWGIYYDSQAQTNSPIAPPSGLRNVVSAAGGRAHAVALKADGTVLAWGDNSMGQTNVPSGLSNVVAVAAGQYNTLALRADGTVLAWGKWYDGTAYVPATVPSGLTNAVAVAAGGFHSLAILANNTVIGWGSKAAGETSIPSALTNVFAVAAGYWHNVAAGEVPQLLYGESVRPTANLGLNMFASPERVTKNGTLVYSLVVRNFGPARATGVLISNSLPPGVSFLSESASQGSCTFSNGVVTYNIQSLRAASSTTVRIAVAVGGLGIVTNTASVTAAELDTYPANNLATAVACVGPPVAGLSLGMRGAPDPVVVGSNLTYTLVVSNAGPQTATGVVITNALPPVAFISASASQEQCTLTNGAVTCSLGSLGVGSNAFVTIVVTPTTMGQITNLAWAFGAEEDLSTNDNFAATVSFAFDPSGPPYTFTTLAGTPGALGSADGTNGGAGFNYPQGVAVDGARNLYVADCFSHTIRRITPFGTNWMVTTIAGFAGQSGSADGTNSDARFNYPSGVAVDSAGNVYVADSSNHTIRKITPAGGVSTLAGSVGNYGSADGTGSAARFYYPTGVAVDGAGNVYVADEHNYTIRKVTSTGVVTTLAGRAEWYGTNDGTGSTARFGHLSGLTLDSAGNVYVTDNTSSTIRRVEPVGAAWVVTTIAGLAGQTGSSDGLDHDARFRYPVGIAVDSAGNLYVGDSSNHTIRRITPYGTNWVVTTIGGLAGHTGSADGTNGAARFYYPAGLAVDGAGDVYVADHSNSTIRRGMPAH